LRFREAFERVEKLQKAKARLTSEGEGDVREPALESLGLRP